MLRMASWAAVVWLEPSTQLTAVAGSRLVESGLDLGPSASPAVKQWLMVTWYRDDCDKPFTVNPQVERFHKDMPCPVLA
jgi:hypothetical protein